MSRLADASAPAQDHQYVIASMRPRHLRQVATLEARVYTRPWSLAVFETELAQRDSRHYLVARAGRRVVGYGELMAVLDEAHITTVVVDPDHRRRGLASRLVADLLAHARATGAGSATLEVRVTNEAAQRLYRGFGFVPVGVRPRYYADTGEGALIMWLHGLQDAPPAPGA